MIINKTKSNKNKLNNIKYLTLGLTLGLCISSTHAIEDTVKQIIATKVSYPVLVNNKPIQSDVVNISGKTYVPIRDAAEGLGANVKWNSTLSRVEINGVGESGVVKNDTSTSSNFSMIDGKSLLFKDNESFISISDINLPLQFHIQANSNHTLINIYKDNTVIKSNIPIFIYQNRTYLSYETYLKEISILF